MHQQQIQWLMDPPVYRLPGELLEQVIFALDLLCGADDRKYRRVLTICMCVSRRWYREFKPHFWAGRAIKIQKTTHYEMEKFLPAIRPFAHDLIIDMLECAIPCYEDARTTLEPTKEWYGAILMHRMFTPDTEDSSQSTSATNDEDITKRIMQEWIQNQAVGWSLWPPPRPTMAPIFFPNLETLELHRIDFSRQSNGRYLRAILEGLPLLRHLTLFMLKNLRLVTHNLVLAQLQSLSIFHLTSSNSDLLLLLSVRCTPYLDRIQLEDVTISRMASLQILDMLLEHGDKDGRCKDSLPIRHIDGLDCIHYNDDDMTVFFENLPAQSLKTVLIRRGLLFGDGALSTLIRHHGDSLQTLYFSRECRFSIEMIQELVTKVPNLRLLCLCRSETSKRLMLKTDPRVPWTCTQLERLFLYSRHGAVVSNQNRILAHLAIRDTTDGRALKEYGPKERSTPEEGKMTGPELRFFETVMAIKELRELWIGKSSWMEADTWLTDVRFERRYGVHGAIGRERGVVHRTVDSPDRGGGYKFYGWNKIMPLVAPRSLISRYDYLSESFRASIMASIRPPDLYEKYIR
ncbi:hypothetical protein BGZ82_005463 [Podila clonocystis]|nr:hypothetical protein BGZ82_005463 [Podila clonocystis]